MRVKMQNSPMMVGRVTPCAPVLADSRTAHRGLAWPTRFALLLGFILLHSSLCLRASGQTYSVDWYKIAGGGGTSTGGTFTVSGTIGQHDAGVPMAGGKFSLTGGFWSLINVVQMPGVPKLIIVTNGPNSVKILWPATGSYT